MVLQSPRVEQNRASKSVPRCNSTAFFQGTQTDIAQNAPRRTHASPDQGFDRAPPSFLNQPYENATRLLLTARRLERLGEVREAPFGERLIQMQEFAVFAHQ